MWDFMVSWLIISDQVRVPIWMLEHLCYPVFIPAP
jgi:hypothetical protein